MAWYKTHQCRFCSVDGRYYAVNIYGTTNPGSVTQLTGAPEPFVTQEEGTDDIFAPVRAQTGYLRVLDTDGTVASSLIPTSNTQRMVRLYSCTYSAGTYTEVAIQWQGFMCAEAFSQPWEADTHVIEFPVKSFLGTLSDISISSSLGTTNARLAGILTRGFTAMLGSGVTPYSSIKIIDDTNPTSGWMYAKLNYGIFFDEVEVSNEGDIYTELAGMSYGTILSEICSTYGVTVRERGDVLFFGHQDKAGYTLKLWEMQWSSITSIANGQSGIITTGTVVTDTSLMENLVFGGTDNEKGYNQGRKTAKVVLNFDTGDLLNINFPQTTEDASEVIEVEDIITGQVFVQPHEPRTGTGESFSFYEYKTRGHQSQTSQPLYELIGASNYNNCLQNTVIYRPLYDPMYSTSDHLHTGAFPCRWYYKKDTTSSPALVNGMFFNQINTEGHSQTPQYCYSLTTPLSYNISSGGYLNIDMVCNNFMRGWLAGDSDKLYFGDKTNIWSKKPQTILYFILKWGNKEWDGTQWVTYSGTHTTFSIRFDGTGVKTNKTTDMEVSETSGWFIPVTEDMEGVITLYFVNCSVCWEYTGSNPDTVSSYINCHSRILCNLSVTYIPVNPIEVSQRTQNTYMRKITDNGFSDDEQKTLILGTWNNNIYSRSFVKDDNGEYIEAYNYILNTTTDMEERPEVHLLNRIAAQYSTVRQTFIGEVQDSATLLAQYLTARYAYQNKAFMAVDYDHNWINNTTRMKFIEVSNSALPSVNQSGGGGGNNNEAD